MKKTNIFKNLYRELYECGPACGCGGPACGCSGPAGGPGGPGGGAPAPCPATGPAPVPGISTSGVLGPCHHDGPGGFGGPGCFHMPPPPMGWYVPAWPKKKKKGKRGKKSGSAKSSVSKRKLGYRNPAVYEDEKTGTAYSFETITKNEVLDGAKKAGADEHQMKMLEKTSDDLRFECAMLDGGLAAVMCMQEYGPCPYLSEFAAFRKGAGAALFRHWTAENGDIWLMAEPKLVSEDPDTYSPNKELCAYYRDRLGLCEYPVENSIWGCTAYFYSTKKQDKNLMKFFDESYSNKEALNEERFSPRDLMNWEAHGRDPRYLPGRRNSHSSINVNSLQTQLRNRFQGQFESVELSDRKTAGGRWTLEFTVDDPECPPIVRGQARVRRFIPQIDRMVSFLRMRDVEVNQYDVSAKRAARLDEGHYDSPADRRVFEDVDIMNDRIEMMFSACVEEGKKMPPPLRKSLDGMLGAGRDYVEACGFSREMAEDQFVDRGITVKQLTKSIYKCSNETLKDIDEYLPDCPDKLKPKLDAVKTSYSGFIDIIDGYSGKRS